MAKIGINISIDVTKIEKARLIKGKKGTYLDATCFINLDEADEYGNHGFIAHSVSKEERDAGERGAIMGNVKVFYQDGNSQPQRKAQPVPVQEAPVLEDFEEDIPF